MKQMLAVGLAVGLALATARGQDGTVRIGNVTVQAGTGSKTITEADTGLDRIAELTSAVLTAATASSATVTVRIVSGTLTNEPSTIALGGGRFKTWDPPARLFVSVGDVLSFPASDTNLSIAVRFWLE